MKALLSILLFIFSVTAHAQSARQLPPMRSENIGATATSVHTVVPMKSSGPSARMASLPMKTGGANASSTTTNGNAATAQKSIVPLKSGGANASTSSANSGTDTAHKSTVPIKTADSKSPATASVAPSSIGKTGSVVSTPATPSAISAKDAAELNKQQATQIKSPSAP